MTDLLDIHTHSLASGHAYSSIREMAEAAKRKGLKLLGVSDHSASLPGAFNEWYFCNFKVIPREAAQGYGIDIVMGVELNIRDYCGSTDLPAEHLARIDYAIASLHDPCIRPGTQEENTAALIGAMRNPKVRIIGHPDNPKYPVDFEALAKAAREQNVLLEVNNSSYAPNGSRRGSIDIVPAYLEAAKKAGAMLIIGSDAHIEFDVGSHDSAIEILKKYNVPEELIVNSHPEELKAWFQKERSEKIL